MSVQTVQPAMVVHHATCQFVMVSCQTTPWYVVVVDFVSRLMFVQLVRQVTVEVIVNCQDVMDC
jgi:hypothetical protein